jgi:hypothetical protein
VGTETLSKNALPKSESALAWQPMKPSIENEVLMNESSSSDAFFEPFEKSASEVLLRLKNEKLTEKEVEENQGIHRIEAIIFELQTTKLQFQSIVTRQSD